MNQERPFAAGGPICRAFGNCADSTGTILPSCQRRSSGRGRLAAVCMSRTGHLGHMLGFESLARGMACGSEVGQVTASGFSRAPPTAASRLSTKREPIECLSREQSQSLRAPDAFFRHSHALGRVGTCSYLGPCLTVHLVIRCSSQSSQHPNNLDVASCQGRHSTVHTARCQPQ